MESIPASILATVITHPIDVVKSNYQTSNLSFRQTLSNVAKNRLFYKGLSAQCCTYPVFWSSFFVLNQHFDKKSPVSAFGTSIIASAIANPFFVLKTRFQTGSVKSSLGYYGFTKSIVRNEGFKSLFKGTFATILNNTKLSLQIPLTHYLDEKLEIQNKYLSVISASFISKILTSTIYYPTDLVRVQQRNSPSPIPFFNTLKITYNTGGFSGLYRGVMLYSLVSIPNYILIMFFMKFIKESIDTN